MTTELEKTREFSVEVVRQLQQAGYQALWAGGCVRDLLLRRQAKDFDVATDATPDEVRDLFGHHRTLAIGASFGVITVLGGKERGQIEVATFRTDLGYSDGRRPDEVRFSSPEEDALRRDFTINGMFYDPIRCQVHDFVGGQRDLKNGLVRSIGNPFLRFHEDKLRMLRAVRFTSTFGFDLQLETQHAIRQYAEHIHVVSAERIAAEMRRMLADPNRADAVRMLRDLCLLRQLLPELEPVVGHAVRWSSTLRSLHELDTEDFRAAMTCLLRHACARSLVTSVGNSPLEPAAAICTRWKLTAEETKTIQWLIRHERTIRAAHQVAWPRLQRLLIEKFGQLLIQTAEAIADGRYESSQGLEHAKSKLRLPPECLNPAPLLTGRDLIQAGMKPGPQFHEILERVRDEQLDGNLRDPQQALQMALQLDAGSH